MTSPSASPAESGARRRHVLCIAYFFPPLGGVSVARMVSFVRNLPDAGWVPTVLAPHGTSYPLRDPSGLAAIPPSVSVRRAWSPEPQGARQRLGRIRTFVAAQFRSIRGKAGGQATNQSTDDRAGEIAKLGSAGPANASRVSLASVRRWLFFPDDQVLWVPFALSAGLQLNRDRLDVIYSTASPVSGHLVAGLLHRLTGVPWVAEFRDPWVGNVLAEPLPSSHRRLQRRLERWIVTNAARVVFLSRETEATYLRRYDSLAGRTDVVPNGYDVEDLGQPPTRIPASDSFRLVYTGALDRPAEAVTFMTGLADVIARRPELARRLTIQFVGHTSPEVAALVAPYLASPNLRSMIRFVPFAPRAEALRHVREADACLVLLGDETGMSQFVPGKLLDYIGLDAPVLAVVPRGEVRLMLEHLDWGVVADPTPAGVADGLERILDGPYRTGRADREGRFERRRLAKLLGSVLDEAAAVAR